MSIIPTLRYEKPNEAHAWLCRNLGFVEHMVHRDDSGRIVHAQLLRGQSMIMIGGTRDDEFSKHCVHAEDVGRRSTQSPYIIVEDVRTIYERCKSENVDIAMDYRSQDYGGESFSCKDPEGNLWNIGSYDPYAD